MNGTLPYQQIRSEGAVIGAIHSGQRPTPEAQLTGPINLRAITAHCWQIDPAMRANASTCLTLLRSQQHHQHPLPQLRGPEFLDLPRVEEEEKLERTDVDRGGQLKRRDLTARGRSRGEVSDMRDADWEDDTGEDPVKEVSVPNPNDSHVDRSWTCVETDIR